ncbi:hypothetical protein ASPWEDRAFT_519305 [Aspergillus wentii DTO 134E9]|uniref:Uncharacterized protein n=1 Tax=Aspergillus wentii DTO 134E9 TaxID=1073089 RepID=A0A1L9RL40_ASPWE|nr:uncharacterized protein ASPWEDRAFT_519305 [Aspergillus wentii DTO 134E9]KAI9924580.1 hypothetical protein MW887_006853 [Aspergillus wentii]OJJ35656.1 hypothetical protein ASPWEDRAFT_519305 [Aspergillus wentii DTO 134E9]
MSGNATKIANGQGSDLSVGNLTNVPDGSNRNNVDRFSQSSAADEPYFARARMQDRSAHASRLSSQLSETDEIMKK